MAKQPKWAHLHEIDKRTRVGSQAWFANNSRGARRLSAWRFLHKLTNSHSTVHTLGVSIGRDPSSRMTTREMLKQIDRLKEK